MSSNPILIIPGEQKSIFFEIFFKSLKAKKYKSPLILICSRKLLEQQMKKFSLKKKIRLLNINLIKNYYLNNRFLNVINVDLKK